MLLERLTPCNSRLYGRARSAMKRIAYVLSAIFALTPPIYSGFIGLGIVAPILWAVAATAFAVGTGWRHQNAGAFKSAVVGLTFCLVVFIPLYFVGRWFS
jgi:hypothetical protein